MSMKFFNDDETLTNKQRHDSGYISDRSISFDDSILASSGNENQELSFTRTGNKSNDQLADRSSPLKRRNTAPAHFDSPSKRLSSPNCYLDVLEPSPGYMQKFVEEVLPTIHGGDNDSLTKSPKKVDILRNLWISDSYEVLNVIFKQLDSKDLMRASLVCKKWRKIISYVSSADQRRQQFLKSTRKLFEETKENRPDKRVKEDNKAHSSKKKAVDKENVLTENTWNFGRCNFFKSPPQSPKRTSKGPKLASLIRCFDEPPERIEGRVYKNMNCPMCRRCCLVDVTYHKGKCVYAKCRYVFCSVCKEEYHPFLACPQRRNYSFRISPATTFNKPKPTCQI
ncbi:hypothetical protein GJ496_004094 [Pomphorhynchus laevis]|nr:hypothetical protein GJ496_004094 [Pomphorhynchus laevis]